MALDARSTELLVVVTLEGGLCIAANVTFFESNDDEVINYLCVKRTNTEFFSERVNNIYPSILTNIYI